MQSTFEFYQRQRTRPARPERLFFCVRPDATTAGHVMRAADRFIREHRLRGSRIRADRLHISLQHAGDYRRLRTQYAYAAWRAGEAVSMSPFEVTLSSIVSFDPVPSKDTMPLVLLGQGDALWELHARLGAAMEENGLRASRNFLPHMTLQYGFVMIPPLAIEPIRFAAQELVLVHSELWLTQYNIIHRWSLKQ